MYTLYTQAPADSGGGVFVRYRHTVSGHQENPMATRWLQAHGLQIDTKLCIVKTLAAQRLTECPRQESNLRHTV
jgi:hypothetical protein